MTASTQQSDLSTRAARLPLAPLAVLTSCLFSLIVILQNPLLNDDAYKYLRAAEVFNAEGARAVLESFGWFHYSILVALLDRIVPGGLVVAAHVLNTALYALLTHAFLQLSRELRPTPRAQLFAALCILALPLTNEMRYFLVRDIGFWAFALLSLVHFIRFARSGDPRLAARWSAALVAATLFRLEGLLLMALLPWLLLLPDATAPLAQRAQRCGQLVGILAAVVLAVTLAALLGGLSLPELVAYAYRWYLPLLGELPGLLSSTAEGIGTALFTPDNYPGSDNTGISFVIALFSYLLVLLANLVNALTLPLALLVVYGRCVVAPGPASAQPAARALNGYIAVAALALLLFLAIMHFLTQRYAALLVLLVLAQVPPVLDELHARAQGAGRLRLFHGWVLAFAFYYLVDSLVSFGYSQQHVEDGIAWAHAELPAGAELKTNNFAIAYGSGRIVDYDMTQRDPLAVAETATSGDYLMLEVDNDSVLDVAAAWPQLVEVTRFANERGDAVRVYRHR